MCVVTVMMSHWISTTMSVSQQYAPRGILDLIRSVFSAVVSISHLQSIVVPVYTSNRTPSDGCDKQSTPYYIYLPV